MRRLILLYFIQACATIVHAQDNTPKYSNEFLNIGVGARAFGMGSSMVSHVEDVTAGYWNPAGLNHLSTDYQLSLMHSAYFAGISNYDYGAIATRLEDESVLSLSIIRFAVDDIADTRLLLDPTGAVNYDNIQFFSAADYAFILSYARVLPWLDGLEFGANAKIIRRIVGDFGGSWGFGLDLGLQKQLGDWNLGLMAKDVFGTFNSWSIADEELASVFAATGNELSASSLEITLPSIVLGGSREFELSRKFSLLTSLDLITTTDGRRNTLVKTNVMSMDPAFGLEFGYQKMVFVRAGVRQFQQIKDFDGSLSWSFQPNAGIGFHLQGVTVDYAFTDIGDQAAGLYSHVFSVKVDFDVED
ncbi:MAG: PorV/PorQ family protein [Cyclobacteriaceae bacterium]